MILKARRGWSAGGMARYLTKEDRSDSVSWMNFEGTYPTIRRDFSRAVDVLYRDRKSNARVKPLHTVIISFHRDELDPKRAEDVELARLLAQSWVLDTYPDRPSLFAVQSDGKGGALHVHIAVSNVGSDGRCLPAAQSDYRKLTRSFTAHMASFGMEDVLHDETGAQKYQRDAKTKVHRFDDVHEKARAKGLNSWKDILSIRLDSVLAEKPKSPNEFEEACERAGVLIRQPRCKGNKSWTSLKNWSFGLAEMNSEAGMESLRATWILTDPKTRLHYATDRSMGGTGRYSREGIMEALGWGVKSKPAKPVEKPKPAETEASTSGGIPLYELLEAMQEQKEIAAAETVVSEGVPLYDLEKKKEVSAPVETEKPKTETKHEPKQEKGTPMKENKFDLETMHRETVTSLYNTSLMLMSMNGMSVDEAVRRATTGGNLADYRADVMAMYKKEHQEAKTAAKPATEVKPKPRSEQPKPAAKQEQKPVHKQQSNGQQKPKQQSQQAKQQQQQKLEEPLTPEALAYEMARDDAMRIVRGGEQNLMITLFAWWNLMSAERALIKSVEKGTDAEMDAMRAEDEAEYQEVEKLGSNRVALERLAKRTMRDLNKGYREGRRFLKRITQQGDIHLTPEQQKISDAYHARQAILRQQSRGEMEL